MQRLIVHGGDRSRFPLLLKDFFLSSVAGSHLALAKYWLVHGMICSDESERISHVAVNRNWMQSTIDQRDHDPTGQIHAVLL
jgi:hypothetical protein